MTDIYFYPSIDTLVWPVFGGNWKAKSGGFFPGQLPPGLYKLDRRNITDYTSTIDKGFIDKTTGQGFFIPIIPQFATSRGQSGGRLGIHPDGDPVGTRGCIGLAPGDTRSFWEAIRSTPTNATITLQVF